MLNTTRESKFHIRRAIRADAETLIKLNGILNDADHLDASPSSVEESLDADSGEVVFVTLTRGRLIGFVSVQTFRSFCSVRPTYEITGVFVLPEMRRHRVGSELVKTVLEPARSEDALEVNLRVNTGNRPAVQFYEACGLDQANHTVFRARY